MRIWIPGLACGLLLATVPLSSAMAEEAPSRLVVHHDRVDPADSDEFEAWYRDWVGAFKESGLGADWNWFTSSSNDFSYVTVSPFGSFADLDQSEGACLRIRGPRARPRTSAITPSGRSETRS